MTTPDHRDPDATPSTPPRPPDAPTTPPAPATEPLHIREATPPPVYVDPADPVAPTTALPAERVVGRPTTPVVPPAVPVDPLADPRYERQRYLEDQRRGATAVFVGVLALLIGGVVGFLIARAVDDDDEVASPPVASGPAITEDVDGTLDLLLERARADGEYRTPSEYPQLDEILAIQTAAVTADLQRQLDALAAGQEGAADLAARVSELEGQLATVTAERDQLATELETAGGDDAGRQAELDAANARIATLESDLATAVAERDGAVTELQQAQAERDAAVAELEALGVTPVADYADGDVAAARADAAANGWTLIEQPVESEAAPGTVLDQAPPANSNMISGSVLVVTVATGP